MEKLIEMTRRGWVVTVKYQNGKFLAAARGHRHVRWAQDDHSLEGAINTLYKKVVNL